MPGWAAARSSRAIGIIGPAYAPNSGLQNVYTTFTNNSPTINVDVDRNKAQSLGVNVADIFNTMQVYLGSVYVNDFDFGGRSYRVYVQADQPYRSRIADLQNIYVRARPLQNGVPVPTAPIPLSGLVTGQQDQSGADDHALQSVPLDHDLGRAGAGHGSGEAIATMQRFASHLPAGFAYEWSGISLEEIESGGAAALIFGARHRVRVFRLGGAVRIVRRSADHPAGRSARAARRVHRALVRGTSSPTSSPRSATSC